MLARIMRHAENLDQKHYIDPSAEDEYAAIKLLPVVWPELRTKMETNPTNSLDRARKIADDVDATPNLGQSPMQNLLQNPPTKAALVKEPESHLGADLGAALAGGDVGAAAQQGGVALNLWNSLPAAKSTDPAICHESEQAMNSDGRRTRTVVLIEMALSTGPKTNFELAEITPRYGARVYDLRKLGYEIQTKRLAGGVVQYSMHKGAST